MTEESPVDVVLRAYAVLEAVLDADDADAAIAAVRADLEVLAPDLLVRVATAVAVEAARGLLRPTDAEAMRRRLERKRVETMWAGS